MTTVTCGYTSIPALLINGAITLQDIPRLRRLPEVRDYRTWLWGQHDPTNAKDVKQAYLGALDRHIKVTDTRWYKAANLTTMTGVGFYLGLVTAPMGPIAGGLAGSVAGTGIGFATDRIAAKLSERPDPTRFATVIDHIRAKSRAKTSISS